MNSTHMDFADLSETQLDELHHLEEELGSVVIAVKPQKHLAHLSDEKLHRLQEAEEQMGMILVPYEKD